MSMPGNASASRVPKQLTPWQKGQSGNPAGRTKGARNRLNDDFLLALQADFSTNGPAAIVEVREQRPHEYLKIIASILPKQIEIKENFGELDDAQLAIIGAALDILSRDASAITIEHFQGDREAGGAQQAIELRPVR